MSEEAALLDTIGDLSHNIKMNKAISIASGISSICTCAVGILTANTMLIFIGLCMIIVCAASIGAIVVEKEQLRMIEEDLAKICE